MIGFLLVKRKELVNLCSYFGSRENACYPEGCKKCEANNITVIVKEPGKGPEERVLINSLESLKELIGEYIEQITLPKSIGLMMLRNMEADLKGLPKNFPLGFEFIRGTVVFCRTRGENISSVYVGDLEKVKRITWGYGGEK